MLRALVEKFVEIRDDNELKGLLWGTSYGFFIMTAYYILRPVRDEISSADRGNLQILWTAVFLVMLVAVPLYSWAVSRWPRRIFVPLANRFFVACLVGFWLSLVFLPGDARPWIDRVFYVWTSVFALFVVTVFWGLMADCFSNNQGKRLFAFIAMGSSLGAMVGSSLTAVLAEWVPTFSLLLIACVPLEIATWCAAVLNRRFATGDVPGIDEKNKAIHGNALSGMKAVFSSPYLAGIAAFIALMTFVSTMLYFQQANLIYEAFADRGERTAFYAKIDLAVNILTLVFQLYLTVRIVRWLGVGVTLAAIPVAMAAGFFALGIWPTLAVLVVVQVIYRAGRYGLTKPAREMLWTVLSREDKYKAKPFLDAAVYRGGDLVSGWIYAGLAAVGLSIGAIALVAAPVAGVWALLAVRLGRREELLAKSQGEFV
ncbi:MAG: MFS transporter [Xanthomonadales bacterium]|nr:MFS transporter [Gammaproteobacteria bacterium]MBT8057836.1 MFS transporter [Gammaproteobacteria bacterium]NNJ78210.1 MFS transporter [Xanthomonadales bacterium]NNL05114.1 MFS transporter [Xanthomonadales bacterium]